MTVETVLLAISTGSGDIALQTARPWEWLFVLAALLAAAVLLGIAWRMGTGAGVDRLAAGVSRLASLPAWAAASFTIGLWALTVALIGFQWDVAWHIDNGRDKELFTVAHTLIVLGIGGVFVAGAAGVFLATRERSVSGWRIRGFHVPRSALLLLLLGIGAGIGFPLDDRWHATYGIDVTMWSPTHLLMIGAAALTTIALWLVMAEGRAEGGTVSRWRWMAFGGVALVGLSALQLEYDQGVPQWQLVFQPLLITTAAGIALVAARVAAGRGAALVSVVTFLVIRSLMLLLVGGAFHYTPPYFALYLPEAILVELAFLVLAGRVHPVLAALGSGVLIGTVGLLGEALWIRSLFVYPWGTELGAYWWQFLLAGVAAAVVGLGLGEALAGRRRTLPGVAAVAGVLVVAGLLGYHVLARHAEPVRVTLTSQAAGPVVAARDREGDFNPGGPVIVTAQVSPASAVGNPDFFEVTAWQGHGRTVHRRLIADGGGRYHADGPIPTGGDWKSIVILNRGDVLEAVPVAMPADRSYGLGLISPPGDGRSADFVPAQNLLMREFHGGLTPVGVIATTLFLAFIVAWVGAMFVAAAGLPGGGAALTWPPLARRRRPALG